MRGFPLALLLICCSVACDDLADYRGAYTGQIVQGNFVRSCFSPDTTADLQFDPDRAVGDVSGLPAASRNWLTTSDGTFERTVLEPISRLEDDQLSKFDFPGPQRVRNYLLLARPEEGPLANRDALVVVSLLKDGGIELRVIGRTESTAQACARDAEADAGAADGGVTLEAEARRANEYFGLFRLNT